MNCWGIRIYFTKLRFSLNGGLFVYMELLSGHEKIITKSGISLNAGTLNRGFTVTSFVQHCHCLMFMLFGQIKYISYVGLNV
jgi:hypothetical protein